LGIDNLLWLLWLLTSLDMRLNHHLQKTEHKMSQLLAEVKQLRAAIEAVDTDKAAAVDKTSGNTDEV
jgi:uncharacterized protein YlxW (UPF0749 family)